MKVCTKCEVKKPDGDFAVKGRKRHSWCKACHQGYTQQHYDENKRYYLEKNRAARARKKQFLIEARQRPCVDCGLSFPYYVMEFDHARGKKTKPVTQLVGDSWKKIHAEIAKCDVVCANCHCIRTFSRRGVTVATVVLEATA